MLLQLQLTTLQVTLFLHAGFAACMYKDFMQGVIACTSRWNVSPSSNADA